MTDPDAIGYIRIHAVIGYICAHHDCPERLALYLPDGRLSCSFAQDQTLADVRELLAAQGYAVDAAGVVSEPKP